MIRLGVNIDHIATIRNARKELFPSVIETALVVETSGADLVTVHLREDQRHIKDHDVILLRQTLKTQLNLEMAATDEMLNFAVKIKPDFVCLVPEKRQELTTEGGLDVVANIKQLGKIVNQLQNNGIPTSLFVDANQVQINAASSIKAKAIEIHTGRYAALKDDYTLDNEFNQIKSMASYAQSLGLTVNAGHGLTYHNVVPIAQIPEINELNIGFAIIAHSIFYGISNSVRQMKQLITNARAPIKS